MKKYVAFVLILLFLMGCGNKKTNESIVLYDYNPTDLQDQLKNAPLQPKLPTRMPFKVKHTTVQLEDNEILIKFDGAGDGKRGDHLYLDIVRSDNSPFGTGNSIKVKLGDINGIFTEYLGRGRELSWEGKDTYYYQLRYDWRTSDTIFTKEQLIRTALSME